MPGLFDEDPESGESQGGSSDDDQNEQQDQPEPMDEGDDQGGEDEGEGEGEGEGEDDDEEGEGEGDDDDDVNGDEDEDGTPQAKPSQEPQAASRSGAEGSMPTSLGPTPHLPPPAIDGPAVTVTQPSPKGSPSEETNVVNDYSIRPEALNAKVYDIVPTIAAPQSTSINVVTATPDLRWVFSGGSDGYIRKFNWVDTANSKLMLTVAQRHPFVDSVTKAGVLTSYWENDDPQATDGQNISPVYSLAVHSQALWLLAGTESGGINLQAVRHEEGKRIHYLKQHTSAVSVLNLARDERSVLSGSWDKLVMDWDLNTGSVKRTFDGAGGQISAIEMRPASSIPVPESSSDPLPSSDTFSSNNDAKPSTNGDLSNGTKQDTTADNSGDGAAQSAASPLGSLFGEDDNGSLFGDNDTSMGGNNNGFGGDADDDDEFSRAVANGVAAPENDDDGAGDVSMIDVGPSQEDTSPQQHSGERGPTLSQTNGALPTDGIPPSTAAHTTPLTNGLPHALDTEPRPPEPLDPPPTTAAAQESTTTDDTTFLAASIDGSIRVWDKRQPAPLAKIVSRNAPPWCMGACWSPDGNYIYAGRRNGTVEEFSLHKGFREASRTFKFPNGSGPVSAVRAMPNGRHLVCASYDILRLYDLSQQQIFKHSTVPFLIVPGHRTGVVSQLFIDPTCRFMISTAGNRGWEGTTTQVLLGYEINT